MICRDGVGDVDSDPLSGVAGRPTAKIQKVGKTWGRRDILRACPGSLGCGTTDHQLL